MDKEKIKKLFKKSDKLYTKSKKHNLEHVVNSINPKASLCVYEDWNIAENGMGYISKNYKNEEIILAIPNTYGRDENEDYFQQRYTVAHQIGHLILHLDNDKLHLNDGIYYEDKEFYSKTEGAWKLEYEANEYATTLLLEKKSFLNMISILEKDKNRPKEWSLELCLSHFFKVPKNVIYDAYYVYLN
jgi:Zn-dependent peptidase ImmA (M78 family)